MATHPVKRALLIAGPTASGKSALALSEARARNGVIINADAIQVYRELRILSARPTADEEALAPHRLYGHVAGTGAYSAARWLNDAKVVIDDTLATGRLPVIVGGTGLYFKALEQGLADVPPIAPDARERWRNFTGDLHAELARRDPGAADRLNRTDRQRVIRALEVIDGTGRPLSHWQAIAQASAPLAGVAVERRFIDIPRGELYARAEARFEHMLAAGALDEVRPLLGLDPMLPVLKAIGVPELSAYLRGEISLQEAVARAKTATRNYIKRQLTWWRGQGRAWFQTP